MGLHPLSLKQLPWLFNLVQTHLYSKCLHLLLNRIWVQFSGHIQLPRFILISKAWIVYELLFVKWPLGWSWEMKILAACEMFWRYKRMGTWFIRTIQPQSSGHSILLRLSASCWPLDAFGCLFKLDCAHSRSYFSWLRWSLDIRLLLYFPLQFFRWIWFFALDLWILAHLDMHLTQILTCRFWSKYVIWIFSISELFTVYRAYQKPRLKLGFIWCKTKLKELDLVQI